MANKESLKNVNVLANLVKEKNEGGLFSMYTELMKGIFESKNDVKAERFTTGIEAITVLHLMFQMKNPQSANAYVVFMLALLISDTAKEYNLESFDWVSLLSQANNFPSQDFKKIFIIIQWVLDIYDSYYAANSPFPVKYAANDSFISDIKKMVQDIKRIPD